MCREHDASKKPLFVEKLTNGNAESDCVNIFEESSENHSSVDIYKLVEDFTSVIYNAAEPCFGKNFRRQAVAWLTTVHLLEWLRIVLRQDQNIIVV